MAEGKDDAEVKHPQQPLPFLELLCKSSGKIRRFAAGTEAGFAVNLINKKLLSTGGGDGGGGGGGGGNCLLATHVEAVKEGEEEPVSFGPTSLLVNYGSAWKLQTVIGSNGGKKERLHLGRERVPKANAHGIDDHSHPSTRTQSSPVSFVYIGKILLAFLLLFVFGAAFTASGKSSTIHLVHEFFHMNVTQLKCKFIYSYCYLLDVNCCCQYCDLI